jgi:PBP1b-binding outer membrane lipoprotein LpoB
MVVIALALFAAGCSDNHPVPPESQAHAQQVLQKDCNNPTWREKNLGLWYSVCRPPMRW